MFIAIDIGNTHIVVGVYQARKLLHSFRLESDRERTVDEYAIQLLSLFNVVKIEPAAIRGVVIGCVVPALSRVFAKLAVKYFSTTPILVEEGTNLGIELQVDEPRSVGADRVVNALAAKTLFGFPALVVDFGTATTFDVVKRNGAYGGGAIAPGLTLSAQALFDRAAKLPAIELKPPKQVIGTNTVDSMLSGIVLGYIAMVDGMVERIQAEIGTESHVIATGGLSRIIVPESKTIKEIVPDLTLEGLRLIAELNGYSDQ